jgi:hypothetical protein
MCFVQAAEAATPALVGGAVAGDGEAVAGAFADRRRGDDRGQRRGQMQNSSIALDLDAPTVVEHRAARDARNAVRATAGNDAHAAAAMGGGDNGAARDHHAAAVIGADQATV